MKKKTNTAKWNVDRDDTRNMTIKGSKNSMHQNCWSIWNSFGIGLLHMKIILFYFQFSLKENSLVDWCANRHSCLGDPLLNLFRNCQRRIGKMLFSCWVFPSLISSYLDRRIGPMLLTGKANSWDALRWLANVGQSRWWCIKNWQLLHRRICWWCLIQLSNNE